MRVNIGVTIVALIDEEHDAEPLNNEYESVSYISKITPHMYPNPSNPPPPVWFVMTHTHYKWAS